MSARDNRGQDIAGKATALAGGAAVGAGSAVGFSLSAFFGVASWLGSTFTLAAAGAAPGLVLGGGFAIGAGVTALGCYLTYKAARSAFSAVSGPDKKGAAIAGVGAGILGVGLFGGGEEGADVLDSFEP